MRAIKVYTLTGNRFLATVAETTAGLRVIEGDATLDRLGLAKYRDFDGAVRGIQRATLLRMELVEISDEPPIESSWSKIHPSSQDAALEAIRSQIQEMTQEGSTRKEVLAELENQGLAEFPLESLVASEIWPTKREYRVEFCYAVEGCESVFLDYKVRARNEDSAKARAMAMHRRQFLGGDVHKMLKEQKAHLRNGLPFTLTWISYDGISVAKISVWSVEEIQK